MLKARSEAVTVKIHRNEAGLPHRLEIVMYVELVGLIPLLSSRWTGAWGQSFDISSTSKGIGK